MCVKGSGRGKACAACVKAKQKCGGPEGRAERAGRAEAEAPAGPAIAEVLRDIVKVLRGVRSDLQEVKHAVEDRWCGEGDDELSDGFTSEDSWKSEADEDLAGLEEDAAEYRAFWLRKHGTEYEEGGVVLKEGGEILEKEDEMEVDGMIAGPSGSAA